MRCSHPLEPMHGLKGARRRPTLQTEVHVSGVSCSVARALDIPLNVVPFPECLFDWLENGPTDILAQMGELVERR